MATVKQQVVTFKADKEFLGAIKHIPNKSEFIRAAVMAALGSTCPLCNGTGLISGEQKKHWKEFMRDHLIEECEECHQVHLVCNRRRAGAGRG
jgi:hypothetical protein